MYHNYRNISFPVACCHHVFSRRCSDGDSAGAVDIGNDPALVATVDAFDSSTWVRLHIVGVAVARSSRLQLAQAAFFHQKLTRHALRWAVVVVA